MKAHLLFGSNEGDRLKNIFNAREALKDVAVIHERSALYETAPWGNEEQPPFLNQALEVSFDNSPEFFLGQLKKIERDLGRTSSVKWGPRLIDIDILLAGELVYKSLQLTIPHPQLHLRRFALVPLSEIAPEALHPVLRITISEVLEKCEDRLQVNRLQPVNEI